MRLSVCLGLAALMSLILTNGSTAAVLFDDNFDVDSTPNWTINNNNVGTNAADIFFDYSTVGIPSAPNSSGATTRGLKLGANLNPATAPASGVVPGISVSPTGESFSGDYTLTFDWWSNYIGPLTAGATGSTMISSYGIMSSGTTATYPGAADSVWFAATGDGQSTVDYRIYAPERPTGYDIFPASGNPLDAHATFAANSRSQAAALYTTLFPAGIAAPPLQQANYSTQSAATPAGAPGFRWNEVEIEKAGNIVTWTVNSTLLGTVDMTGFATPLTGGNILFGHADTNLSTNSMAALLEALQFTLIDNVVVESASAGTPGDFNNDGVLTGRDFLAWQRGDSDVPFSSGDLTTWQNAYNGGALASVTAVPEPAAVTLLGMSILAVAFRRK